MNGKKAKINEQKRSSGHDLDLEHKIVCMQMKNIGLPVFVVQIASVEAMESDNGQKGSMH